LQTDGKILIGVNGTRGFTNGSFTNTKMVVRLNEDGSLDSSFNASALNIGPEAPTVYDIAVQPDGHIIVGGVFTYNNNGAPVFSIARLNADGSIDSSFALVGGPTQLSSQDMGSISALALQSDGKVVIAGSFRKVGLTLATNFARLNPNGSVDTTFNTQNPTSGVFASGIGISATISAVELQPDGKILAGGSLGENLLAPRR
jgi:uncharacterized delta-60 repeat protein